MKDRFYSNAKLFVCLGVLVLVLLGLTPQTQAVDVSFDPAVNFPAGSGPRSVTIVDLNNDGNLDMVVANSYDSTVTVRLGDGSGGFGTAMSFGLGGVVFPMKVVSADLNEDGNADLVTANYISGDVSVLFGNGDGTFQDAVIIPMITPLPPPDVTSGPMWVAIDDLNKDGHMDLVIANYEAFTISVLFGDGSGNFGMPVNYSVFGPNAVAIGDLNKDGNKDLIVLDTSNSMIYVLFGDGLGGFGPPSLVFSGLDHPRSLAVADLNADNNLDIAVASFDDHKVYVLMGNGDGTFQGAVVGYLVGAGPHDVAVGDLNGDGKPDIAVANSGGYSVSVLLNDGLGGFGTASDFSLGSSQLPLSLAIADLNSDLKPDIVTANFDSYDATVLFNTTPSSPRQQISATLEFFDASVSEGTLTGNGSGNSANNKLNTLRNMIEQAEVLIEAGDVAGACQQLVDAYKKTDGKPKPPDFVQGSSAGELADNIMEAIGSLHCATK